MNTDTVSKVRSLGTVTQLLVERSPVGQENSPWAMGRSRCTIFRRSPWRGGPEEHPSSGDQAQPWPGPG